MATVADQFYKIKLCPFQAVGYCRKATSCTYAHSEEELRVPISLKKTKLCAAWKKGVCQDTNCPFAHGESELKSTPNYYKTSICRFWKKGTCEAGSNCRHAHGLAELRDTRHRRKAVFRKTKKQSHESSTSQPLCPSDSAEINRMMINLVNTMMVENHRPIHHQNEKRQEQLNNLNQFKSSLSSSQCQLLQLLLDELIASAPFTSSPSTETATVDDNGDNDANETLPLSLNIQNSMNQSQFHSVDSLLNLELLETQPQRFAVSSSSSSSPRPESFSSWTTSATPLMTSATTGLASGRVMSSPHSLLTSHQESFMATDDADWNIGNDSCGIIASRNQNRMDSPSTLFSVPLHEKEKNNLPLNIGNNKYYHSCYTTENPSSVMGVMDNTYPADSLKTLTASLLEFLRSPRETTFQ